MSSSLTWTSRSTSNHERAFLVANATLRHNDLPDHFCAIGAINDKIATSYAKVLQPITRCRDSRLR